MERSREVNLRPKAVWLGLTIPGKKMAAMVAEMEGYGFKERGSLLNTMYSDPADSVLMKIAIILHYLPRHGVRGPAFRHLVSRDTTFEQFAYGAILTDIRDFLKLRFRGRGLIGPSTDEILGGLTVEAAPEGVEPEHPGSVINYAISALDALCRDREGKADLTAALKRLRDLFRATSRQLDTAPAMLREQMDKFYDQLFQD